MNDIVNSQNKINGTKTNSENSSSSKNSTKVQPGDQYVVDGAIFKCQYGATPSQLLVASNQKVMAQGKAIASDKDVTFKIATAPFATCTLPHLESLIVAIKDFKPFYDEETGVFEPWNYVPMRYRNAGE